MKLPEQAMGANCPVSVGANDVVSSEHQYVAGAGGFFFGRGPVYVGLNWKPRDREEAYFDLDRVPIVPDGYRLKTAFIMDPAYDGEALVRGSGIGKSANREILFNGGPQANQPAMILRSGDRKVDALWGFRPSSMILPEPGCYAIQIDTEMNSDIVVFEATLTE